jgi:DNA-directed RNA polymerase I subunit RPA43
MVNIGFERIKTRLQIHLAPTFINNTDQGITEYLGQMVTKYIPELEGVLISFANIRKLDTQCVLKTESPFLHFYITVELTLFRPKLDMVMVGIVNKVSPDHVGCLVNGYFNCSIAKDQFATGYFQWDDEHTHWKASSSHGDLVIKPGKMVIFSIIKY